MATKYIKAADANGWLTVRYGNGSTYPPLPQGLEVNFIRTEGGRDVFTIAEGLGSGREASVTRPASGSYLLDSFPRLQGITCTFDLSAQQLTVAGLGTFSAITDPGNPVPRGTHALEIPYEVHGLGRGYLNQSRYATTWFRIGHSGDRFLHPGRVSAGCTTVTDVGNWTRIYERAIAARLRPGVCGTLIVVA